MIQCSVATSCETGKLVFRLMIYFVKISDYYRSFDIPELTIDMYYWLSCNNSVVVSLFWNPLMKSQNHETSSSMKLTSGGNMYDQNTRNWYIPHQYACTMVQTRYFKEYKLHFKILQNISLIVCIKKTTKCVVILSSQHDFNVDFDVGMCQIYLY